MAGPRRSDYQKHRDRQVLVKLWAAQIYTQVEMAQELQRRTGAKYKLTQQQISYDLKLIKKDIQKFTAFDMAEARAEEIAKLEALSEEALRGYKRSIRQKEKHSRKVKNDEDGNSKEIQVKTEDIIGERGWLDTALGYRKQIAKIKGIEAPKKIDFRDRTREKFDGDDPEGFVKQELQHE